MSHVIHSVGHGDRTLAELLALLGSSGVEVLIDVRRRPVSKRHPQFRKETLSAACAAAGVDYRHLGVRLGGFREEGYEAWMRERDFQEGLAEEFERASYAELRVTEAGRTLLVALRDAERKLIGLTKG